MANRLGKLNGGRSRGNGARRGVLFSNKNEIERGPMLARWKSRGRFSFVNIHDLDLKIILLINYYRKTVTQFNFLLLVSMYLSRRQHQPLSWCGDRSLDLKKKKMALYSIIIVHSPPRNFHSPQIFGFRIREATITISTLYSISLPRGEPSRNSKHTFEVENSEENWIRARFQLLICSRGRSHKFISSTRAPRGEKGRG